MRNKDETEERRRKIKRLRERSPDITVDELAVRLGVSTRTVQRDLSELYGSGALTETIAANPAMRDALFSLDETTLGMIDQAIRRTNEAQEALHAELGYDQETCECCGRPGLKFDKNSALAHQAYYAGGRTLNDQITTRAKLRGELVDNYIITVQQIDSDLLAIMAGISNLHELVANEATMNPDGTINVSGATQALLSQIYTTIRNQSLRRQARLPAVSEILDQPQRFLALPAPRGDDDDER